MADLILKVTPEEVRAKGSEIQTQQSVMEGYMQEMLSKVNSLGDSWKATSGESYIDKYQNVTNNIRKSLEVLNKHYTNLVAAADRYEQLESSQTQAVNALRSDGIFN